MLALKNAIKLSQRVAVYIPSTIDVDTATDNREQIAACASLLSSLFGGATATAARGYWMSGAAGLVGEDVTVVYSFGTAEQMTEHMPDVVRFAEQLKKDMAQEAISLEYNGELYLI